MPASRFFAMLEAGRRIRNKEYVLGCWQARAGTVNKEGFQEIVQFLDTFEVTPPPRPPDVKMPPLKGEQARATLAAIFSRDHRVQRGRIKVH